MWDCRCGRALKDCVYGTPDCSVYQGPMKERAKPVPVQPYQRPPEPVRSNVPVARQTKPFIERAPEPVPAPMLMGHPETVTLPPAQEVRRFEEPRKSSKPPADSKKDFEKPHESKKDFEPTPISKKKFEPEPEIEDDAPVFDRDGDEGRWRTDDQVKELVIYRWEFKRWPDDVEDKVSHPTGLESYYELRYFKAGSNRKGEKYSELYGKHRAKRDLWIEEESQRRAIGNAQLDSSTAQSNVVRFAARRANSAG